MSAFSIKYFSSMLNTWPIIGLFASIFSTFTTPAEAINVTFGTETYRITTVEGTYVELVDDVLSKQPWWQSQDLGVNLAERVNSQLGLTNNRGSLGTPRNFIGPLFAFDFGGEPAAWAWNSRTQSVFVDDYGSGTTFTYARVPESDTILGSLFILAIGAVSRQKYHVTARKKH